MKNYIKIRIAAHADKVIKKYGKENVLGVFLYGSQNYNLATENSDVDTVAIIVPTFSDLCLRSPISKELNIDEEHCNVKDIREYMKMIRKQNINFTETLFTEYFLVNPKYQSIWNLFTLQKNNLVQMDPDRAIIAAYHQAENTFKRILNFEDNDIVHDCKRFVNTYRLIDFCYKFYNGKDFLSCIQQTGNNRERLLKIKAGTSLIYKELGTLVSYKDYVRDNIIYSDKKLTNNEITKTMDFIINSIIMSVIRENI